MPNSAIYRYTNLTDSWTGVGFTDKIEFDVGVTPDATGHVTSSEFTWQRSLQENPRPQSNNPNELQDNGLGQILGVIVGTIESPDTSLIDTTVQTWMTNNMTNSNFPWGRFGIHLADRPLWNTAPITGQTNGGGFMIEKWYSRKVPGFAKVDFICNIRYNGSVAWIGAGT